MIEETTSAQPTPGPWQADLESAPYCSNIPVLIEGSGFAVAMVCNVDSFGTCIDDEVTDHEINEMERSARANAHLIAAAPDLLKSCESVLHCMDYDEDSYTIKLLRGAIAKAKGGAS